MKNFMTHDLIGLLSVLTSVSGAVWAVIKFTFVKSFDQLTVHADTPHVDMVDVSNHNGGTSRIGDTSC